MGNAVWVPQHFSTHARPTDDSFQETMKDTAAQQQGIGRTTFEYERACLNDPAGCGQAASHSAAQCSIMFLWHITCWYRIFPFFLFRAGSRSKLPNSQPS